MTYRYLLFLLLLVWGHTLLAQREYQPGYIVKPSADTLRGLVRYTENHQQALSCCFRPDKVQQVVCYQPNELAGYGFDNGRMYESIMFEGEPIFMQVLASGNATLLKHNQQYYVQKNSIPPIRLEVRDTLVYRSGRPLLARNRLFVGVLRDQLMADCPAVAPLLARAALQDRDLITIFDVYNNCRETDGLIRIASVKADTRLRITMGAGAGWSYSTLGVFSERILPVQTKLHTHQPALPTPFLLILISTPRVSQRFEFQTGLNYLAENFRYTSTESTTDNLGSSGTEHKAISVALRSLRLPVMVRYTVPGLRIHPYLAAGPSFIFMLHSDSNFEVEREYNQVVNSYRYPFLNTRPVTFSLSGALGLKIPLFNRISAFCEGRYDHTFEGIAQARTFDTEKYPHALGFSSIQKTIYKTIQAQFGLIYR
ncbi:outer membrane beta-barrel protein [Telluribacter sp. SYSU D00476]|uniref:outer membrane beta-barrel protein n=1 Tax=Telluribacter sp. SYSU D00476 TaxID=2811430 RepID=UPI001FF43DEF|nr:outer membrane beta-barrel protein [Telluribacter sp. SYSU D00476]